MIEVLGLRHLTDEGAFELSYGHGPLAEALPTNVSGVVLILLVASHKIREIASHIPNKHLFISVSSSATLLL